MSTRIRVRTRLVIAVAAIAVCSLLPSPTFGEKKDSACRPGEPRAGSTQDQVCLAKAYLVGRGVERNESQAAYWFEKAADVGDPEAQRALAHLYQVGLGVPRDPAKASRWLERAVAGGSLEARVDLATNYLWGAGVRKDVQVSATWFQKAADKGSARAATYLGDMHHFGIGMPIDDAGARRWYEIGAKRNDSLAQYRLGLMLLTGRDADRRSAQAADLFRKAGQAGLVAAKFSLGVLLSNKPELASFPNEGEIAIEEAAVAGTWKASATLGIHAFNGAPNKHDPERACFWFQVARLQGGDVSEPALRRYLDAVSLELGIPQTKVIDAAAEKWFEDHKTPIQYIIKTPSGSQQDISFGIAALAGETHTERIVATPNDIPLKSPF